MFVFLFAKTFCYELYKMYVILRIDLYQARDKRCKSIVFEVLFQRFADIYVSLCSNFLFYTFLNVFLVVISYFIILGHHQNIINTFVIIRAGTRTQVMVTIMIGHTLKFRFNLPKLSA